MSSVLKKFKQDIIGILFLSVGLFLVLSLWTFNPADPSLNSIGQSLKPTNACGFVGSFLSDLLFQFFGLSAWILAITLVKSGVDSFRGAVFNLRNLRIIWAGLLLLTFSTLVSVYWPQRTLYQGQIFPGGVVGLGLSKLMIKAFNLAGVQIILWSLSFILIVFYSDKTVHELTQWPHRLGLFLLGGFNKIRKNAFAGFMKIPVIKKKNNLSLATASVNSEKHSENQVLRTGSYEQMDLKDAENKKIIESNLEEDDIYEDSEEKNFFQSAKRKVTLKAKPPRRIENWEMPKIGLLEDPPVSRIKIDEKEIRRKADLLTDKLKNFSIEGLITDAKPGPLVTMYEFKPNADVKISKISELEDDLSLALSSESVRVVGHIPGRDVVGIETANLKRETVYYKDLVAENQFWNDDFALPMALGRQVNGEPKIVDLRKMPHLLIAGTTGSGKSVFVSSIITGLLFKHSPKTLRLILIDPKMVDLAHFSKIPHLILPHITEAKKAAMALKWAVKEMEKRYKSLSKFGVSKIELFNEKISQLTKEQISEHEKINLEIEAQNKGRSEQYYYQTLPYIVIVVDELADLMVVEKQNVEQPIQRLTQMARACGMHIILATQSPRKDVVTGLIKTNIPGRIGLKVASKMDSRIILDDSGAERLLPNGDMLFLAPGVSKPLRHHGPYLSDKEISEVVNFWSAQGEPEYDQFGLKALDGIGMDNSGESEGGSGGGSFEEEHDEMYDQILAWTAEQKDVSASLLQRKFRLGYPRAARMIELFEKEGVVGPANGSKPRQVLINGYKD